MPQGPTARNEQGRGLFRQPVGGALKAGAPIPVKRRDFFNYNNLDLVATNERLVSLNENQNRVYFLIQNNGLVDVFVSFGAGRAGARVVPGGSYELNQFCPNNSIYIYTTALASSAACVVVEGVRV